MHKSHVRLKIRALPPGVQVQAAPSQLPASTCHTERKAQACVGVPGGPARPLGFQTEPRGQRGGLACGPRLTRTFTWSFFGVLHSIADSFSSEILFPEQRMNTENLCFPKANENCEKSN